eukprot:CAMPEP_0172827420 /NCGR_PEP_ID=MMETSP1075-20121228/20095_1 /TAXON_ID=2916 /ORGANISM="Ceratium fusus, Strain PA161109" /LENGTH=153 /DNA_ID=CAMNT_0013669227 /DNA_START=153 /DNA_END=614 /DNA_ORIENTATION=-
MRLAVVKSALDLSVGMEVQLEPVFHRVAPQSPACSSTMPFYVASSLQVRRDGRTRTQHCYCRRRERQTHKVYMPASGEVRSPGSAFRVTPEPALMLTVQSTVLPIVSLTALATLKQVKCLQLGPEQVDRQPQLPAFLSPILAAVGRKAPRTWL